MKRRKTRFVKKEKKNERNEEERETFSSEIDTVQFDGANCELDWIIQPAPGQVFSNLSLWYKRPRAGWGCGRPTPPGAGSPNRSWEDVYTPVPIVSPCQVSLISCERLSFVPLSARDFLRSFKRCLECRDRSFERVLKRTCMVQRWENE